MNAILTIALLTLFVVLHELGHYISARRSKIAVSEFFVGFGPKIFSFKKNKTEYGLKAFLLGGYVKIPGMDQNEIPMVMKIMSYFIQQLGQKNYILHHRELLLIFYSLG